MVASVPLFTKRTLSTPVRRVTSSASSTSRRLGAPKDVPPARASAMASRTAGWLCPRIMGPHEPMWSIRACPSASMR